MLRTALEALTFRLDGSRAAANTIIRKRAVLHGALGYAAEAGLLPDNPLDTSPFDSSRKDHVGGRLTDRLDKYSAG